MTTATQDIERLILAAENSNCDNAAVDRAKEALAHIKAIEQALCHVEGCIFGGPEGGPHYHVRPAEPKAIPHGCGAGAASGKGTPNA